MWCLIFLYKDFSWFLITLHPQIGWGAGVGKWSCNQPWSQAAGIKLGSVWKRNRK